jgi:hypothetical protein
VRRVQDLHTDIMEELSAVPTRKRSIEDSNKSDISTPAAADAAAAVASNITTATATASPIAAASVPVVLLAGEPDSVKDDVSSSNPAEVFVRGINRRATEESILEHFSRGVEGRIESLRWTSAPKSERKGHCKSYLFIVSNCVIPSLPSLPSLVVHHHCQLSILTSVFCQAGLSISQLKMPIGRYWHLTILTYTGPTSRFRKICFQLCRALLSFPEASVL